MKKNLKRAMALSLAVMATAAMPMSNVFAASEGTITASFTVDSPTLTVTVPTTVQLHVNTVSSSDTMPIATTDAGDYRKLPIYSDPIKISNATLDSARKGVPVVATLYATLKPSANVKVAYDAAKVNVNGGEKNVYLQLVGEPYLKKTTAVTGTGDTYDLIGNGSGDTVPATAVGLTGGKNGGGLTVATPYGSMMQIAVPGPISAAAGDGESKPAYGGFTLMGKANLNETWADGDLGVDLYYKVKASHTSYDADAAVDLAKDITGTKLVEAANGAGGAGVDAQMLDAIKTAEGLGTTPTNAYKTAGGATLVEAATTNDAYFAIEGVDPTLTVTKFGYNFTDENGASWDYDVAAGDYKTANIYCADAGATDRLLYINFLKNSAARAFAGELGKKKGANDTVKFFVVLSDGSVLLKDVVFEKKA